jgi:hypothetical protein
LFSSGWIFAASFSSESGANSDAAKLQHSFWFCGGSVFGIPETNVSGFIVRAHSCGLNCGSRDWTLILEGGA